MIRRTAILAYAVASYGVFFATFLYAIGFIGGFGVPKMLDGEPTMSLGAALAVNLGLLGLFAIQHSVMARPAFKRWWTRHVPVAAERSTYVLFSSIALIVLFAFWQPLGGQVWHTDNSSVQVLAYSVYAVGWLTVLVATFLINHFDLFGLRQAWYAFRGQPCPDLKFVTPGLYRHVRHPLYVGWLLVMWATPSMTVTHLLFAAATTAYILIAVRFEERDLMNAFPGRYASYRRDVPMLIPRLFKNRKATGVAVGEAA